MEWTKIGIGDSWHHFWNGKDQWWKKRNPQWFYEELKLAEGPINLCVIWLNRDLNLTRAFSLWSSKKEGNKHDRIFRLLKLLWILMIDSALTHVCIMYWCILIHRPHRYKSHFLYLSPSCSTKLCSSNKLVMQDLRRLCKLKSNSAFVFPFQSVEQYSCACNTFP